MPPMSSPLAGADAILADVIVPPIVTSFGFLWLVLLPVIALVEGAIIARFYTWPFGRAFWIALWINVLTGLLGIFPAMCGEFGAQTAISNLSIWAAFHAWPLIALALLLACYLVTFLVEGALLQGRARRASPSNGFRKALKVSALFNVATYLMIAPVWFIGMAASMRGATLVHKSQWLPEIDEAFLYEHPDGRLWLGTTSGKCLGQVCSEQSVNRDTALKISDDGRSLIVLSYTVADDDPGEGNVATPAVRSTTEIARYDLSSLDPKLLDHIRPGSTRGLPWRDPDGHIGRKSHFDLRDGTLAYAFPFPSPSPFEGRPLELFLHVKLKEPPARVAWPNQLEYDFENKVEITGWRGLMLPLRFTSANVLPGGRYVLFECSGEIMVLDVETRKLVSLFPGSNPVALSSFEPEAGDQPPIPTDGTD